MRWSLSVVLFLASGCGLGHRSGPPATPVGGDAPALHPLESAPPASDRLAGDLPNEVDTKVANYFEGNGTQRVHVQLDRPLYRPGETVWVKTWSVASRGLAPSLDPAISYELVNPRGQVVASKQVRQQLGAATNDFVLPADAPGGQWLLRATLNSGGLDERVFIVSNYQPPQIRKKLEFVREAYGPGQRVDALVELEQVDGPLAEHEVRALLQVAGETVLEQKLTTDASGALLVSATLPEDLTSSDGLLTVLVEAGGVTESISRSVPIVLADVNLAFFPEGGALVQDLPGRVYFEATNVHGEPADVSGHVTNDLGERVADFRSVHDGMGRFALDPAPGRVYIAHITSPPGLVDGFVLPAAAKRGCTVRAYDDVHSELSDVRVGVRCTASREVLVTGVQRETTIDTALVKAGPTKDAVVYLQPGEEMADQQGAVRVTVFDRERTPLAERLVYRNRGRDLQIGVTPHRERYGPRDEVVLAIETTDPSGEPVEAELALAVVDDAVLRLADDKEGHILSRLYLAPELVDSPKDPGWYFDSEDRALAARGLDLVMGTRGYRHFEWRPVWDYVRVDPRQIHVDYDGVDVMVPHSAEMADVPRVAEAAPPPPPPQARREVRKNKVVEREVAQAEPVVAAAPMAKPREAKAERHRMDVGDVAAGADWDDVMMDEPAFGGIDGLGGHGRVAHGWAAVRVFPKPNYQEGFTGTRTDFRDTVHWEPSLRTGSDGRGELRFYLSDAVTTFRVTAEGLGAGRAGHSETTLTSVLPVSVATKLPAAVSAGDRLVMPITVSNTRDSSLQVDVSGEIDSEIVSIAKPNGTLTLPAQGTETHWVPVQIGEGNDTVAVTLQAEGKGYSDRVQQQLRVVPAGFPRSWSAAGEEANTELVFQLDEVVKDSLSASVTWHPGSVSTLISGMEGLIRSPGGCFEQTSSTNWPNVAILSYLEAHDGDPRLRVKSSQALDVGYAKLTGYQVDAGGFETWGSGPGKEALSAFGLLQFADMQKVYPVEDPILSRDADFLLAQRTGKGGFKNTGSSAHGYGSAPAAVLDGFITYALVTTGFDDGLDKEIAHQAQAARDTEDPYVLALAARTLLQTDHAGAGRAVERLVALQDEDGSFPGAESSITRSYEANLLVESTALAALALMEDGGHRSAADRAADWLIDNRQGAGTWGATQATALALSALTTHAEVNKVPRTGGKLFIEVNGKKMGTLSYAAEQTAPLTIGGWQSALREGDNTLVLRQESGEPLPFSVEVAWTAIAPLTSPGAELSLDTSLSTAKTQMGETVRLTATIENQTDRIVPSPIARIGLPAGLEPQIWQLKQLQERGQVAFYETRLREVTLYWDGIHVDGTHTVDLDLVAMVPGTFTGPSSSAYPYYNDDEKAWDGGLKVTIDR